MTIVKTSDSNYPYTIKGGWGDEVYCTLNDLKSLQEKIFEILKKDLDKKN